MTLNRKVLKRVHSPVKSPKRNNTSLRKKALIKQLNNEVQFGAASKANLKVVVRVRPQNQQEEENNAKCVVRVVDDHMLIFDPKEEEDEFFFKGVRQRTRDLNKRPPKEQKFVFERVFNVDSSNEDIYEATTKDIVSTVLSGYNCSVFAYGATGAGKTFTMLGKAECPGITFLTLMELYRCIEEIKEEKTCEVGISYVEVYNEMVRDLLQPGKPLNVQEAGQQVLIPGLSLHKPNNTEELMQMLAVGNQNRTQHPTDANAESSRSHAVFQIFVRQQERTANVKGSVSIAKLSMIDLAGSERGTATGFKGARFREGASINKSLLALGNCINALADGQRHIPYRDSKLTRLLKDSLGGNCRSVMIAAVSPASTTFEDTYNTLRYANRAKTIKTTIKKNLLNVDQHVSNYLKIVEDLRQEICSLKEKVKQYEEKEKEWEVQREELTAVTAQPLESAPQQETKCEKKIAVNDEHMLEKCAKSRLELHEPSLSEEEAEIQKRLVEASHERKALRWELHQLLSSQREIEYKIHTCTTHLHRMKIIAFASQRLDKSISKCERTIRNLNNRLSQIQKLQQSVEMKLNANFAKLEIIRNELNHLGPSSSQPSKGSQELIEKNEANLALRDLHQLAEYLRGLVKEGFQEQNDSEQLISLLLVTARRFYVHLRAQNQCTPEIESLFKNVAESMDESKIIWADQQRDEKHTTGERESSLPLLDISHFTSLPITSSIFISPTANQDHTKIFRKSSMKSAVSAAHLPDKSLQPAPPHEEFGAATPTLFSIPESNVHTSPVSHFKKFAFSKSPVLLGPRYEKQEMNDRRALPVITTDLSKEISSALLTPKKTLPMLENSVPSVLLNDMNGNETESFGYVSMVEGCGVKPVLKLADNVKITSANFDTTELLQDIQPLECSVNATFAITPAKMSHMTDHMTVKTADDEPADSVNLNANSDVPNNSLTLNTVIEAPTRLTTSNIIEIPHCSSHVNILPSDVKVDVEMPFLESKTSVSVPSITKKQTAAPDLTEQCSTVDLKSGNDTAICSMPLSTTLSSVPVINGDTNLSVESRKTASRKLFSSSVLDATFSVDEESESRGSEQKLQKSPLDVSPGCTTLKMKSGTFESYEGQTVTGVPQCTALISLENKKEESSLRIPTVSVTTSEVAVVPPPLQDCKGIFRNPIGITPQKSPGRGTTPGKRYSSSKSATLGKIQLSVSKSNSAMKRSVSTSSIPSSQMNISRAVKQSPNVKKFAGFGRTLHRTTSFFKAKTPVGSNQENVPPMSRKVIFQSLSSTLCKDTVSSAAKQSAANYKP
ncbi:uncharacterized protein [Panulirus ornatus]|uniref:uncharacterized protein n=1 Tax=Panulirus ornatus TaxID=150431 RepID=UPI003A84BE3A